MTVQKPEDNLDFANLGNAGAASQNPGSGGGTPQPKPLDVATIINTFGGSSRGESDAEVAKVHAVVKEILDANKEAQATAAPNQYVLVNLSSKRTGNFGALVICTARTANQQTLIFASTLLVEKSRSTGPLDMVQIPGIPTQPPIEMFVGAADVFNQNYFQHIQDEVQNAYSNKNARVVNVGYQVIYDLTSIAADDLRPMVREATSAIDHSLDLLDPNRQIFNLAQVVTNPQLRVRTRVTTDARKTEPSGLPVRSDLRTDLFVSQTNNQKGLISQNTEVRLCETSAYVDLIYIPNQINQFQQHNPYAPQPPSYIPRIVITNFTVDLPMSAMEFMLLGVAQMVALANNRAYGVVWRNQFGQSANNIRNFGAVGLQVPGLLPDGQPGIIDVTGDVRDLYNLMERVLTPQPVFSLEIAQGGQGNWATKVFAMAGEGNQEAISILITAADNLTNHNFSKIWSALNNSAPQPLITTSEDLNHIGYYNRDGEYHDIRELDLLAMLNTIGTKDTPLVMDYLATLAGSDPSQVRLYKRLRILQRVAKDVHIKAYSKKYDFGGNFIEALTRAIAACGVVIGSDSLLSPQDTNVYTQSAANWQQSMVNPAMLRQLFQVNQQQMPNIPFPVGNLFGYGR